MIPNVSGSTPPPIPWIARAAIRTPMVGAIAARKEPTASAPSAKTSIRSLPTLSPTRPTIGVHTDADSRYAVSTHVTVAWSVPRPRSMVASTGVTIDWRSEKDPTPTHSTTNVRR